MENKRGQFYIVAAIIIALILTGMSTLTTYATLKSEPRTVKELSSDLKHEGARIVDYGIFSRKNLTGVLYDLQTKNLHLIF